MILLSCWSCCAMFRRKSVKTTPCSGQLPAPTQEQILSDLSSCVPSDVVFTTQLPTAVAAAAATAADPDQTRRTLCGQPLQFKSRFDQVKNRNTFRCHNAMPGLQKKPGIINTRIGRSGLSTWKYQFSYDHWSQATLSSVSGTWMGDCSSVAWVLLLTLKVG